MLPTNTEGDWPVLPVATEKSAILCRAGKPSGLPCGLEGRCRPTSKSALRCGIRRKHKKKGIRRKHKGHNYIASAGNIKGHNYIASAGNIKAFVADYSYVLEASLARA